MAVDITSFQLEAARLFMKNKLKGIRAALTGSLALFMHGFDLERDCSDIDLIADSVPKKLPKGWKRIELPKDLNAPVYEVKTKHFNYTFKVHIIVHDGFGDYNIIHGMNVTTFQDIIDAKLDFGMTGTTKHLQDFHKMLTQLYLQVARGDAK